MLVAASDYVKALPDSIDKWLPRPLIALGTDGFGRSESRASLRDFFEVDYRYVVVADAGALSRARAASSSTIGRPRQAIQDRSASTAETSRTLRSPSESRCIDVSL